MSQPDAMQPLALHTLHQLVVVAVGLNDADDPADISIVVIYYPLKGETSQYNRLGVAESSRCSFST